MRYVLDTNVFNQVLDDKFALSALSDACGFVATKVQFCELEKTKKPPGRRAELLKVFDEIAPTLLAAAFSLDIPGAGLDEGEWSDDERIQKIRQELEAIKSKPNNWHDALIAGIALKYGYGLVTSDGPLAVVAERYGIRVHRVAT
jgi:predicted nucleic acid-binding protein